VKYGDKMVRCHGLNFDLRHEQFDASTVHTSGGGKAHGQLALAYRIP
jgi:hypothetical protein